MTISTATLKLPSRVIAPEEIQVIGNITGANNEIIVLKQLRNEVFSEAYVCHLTLGQYGYGIYDMPEFRFIKVSALSALTFNNVKYTMACTAENIHSNFEGFGLANWLH